MDRRSPASRVLLGLCALAPAALAQPGPGEVPAQADYFGRLVARFDFERDAAMGDAPLAWDRVLDDPDADPDAPVGFPVRNEVRIDAAPGRADAHALLLRARGGSVRARLRPGAIPILPDADYLVTARVRTEGLEHARAQVTCRFLDQDARPLPEFEWRSGLIDTRGRWETVALAVRGQPGLDPPPAYVQVDLDLLQPARFARPTLGAHQVWVEDGDARAWFTGLAVWHTPRVRIETATVSNIIVAPARPELTLHVRDLTSDALRAVVEIRDMDGRRVDATTRELSRGVLTLTWTPALDVLGWYRATLRLERGTGEVVGTASTDFVWLPAGPPWRGADRALLGLVLRDVPPQAIPAILQACRRLDVGAVTIPVWTGALELEDLGRLLDALAETTGELASRGTRATFALERVPATLAGDARVDPDDPAGLIVERGDDVWRAWLEPALARFGQRVGRWQIGAPADDRLFWEGDEGAQRLAGVRDVLARLVPGPTIVVPWRADRAADPAIGRSLRGACAIALHLPGSLAPESIPEVISSWRTPGETPVPVTLVVGDGAGAPTLPRSAVTDLVRRAVEFWATLEPQGTEGASSAIALVQPWSIEQSDPSGLRPTPLLAAWRSLGDRLAGRRVLGEFPAGPGIRCLILSPRAGDAEGEGMLVAWRVPGGDGPAAVRAPLALQDVRVIDAFGNTRVASPLEREGEIGMHEIPVGEEPVFVEGVDPGLALFLAGLRFEPPLLPTTDDWHEARLIVTNPWPARVTGRVLVTSPGGRRADGSMDRSWMISPRARPFSIDPGQTIELPMSITFGRSEEAGEKHLRLVLDVDALREYRGLRVAVPFEIGLASLGVELSHRYAPTPQGPDVIFQVELTNRGSSPLALSLRAFAPGMPIRQAGVSDLAPGMRVTRYFRYEGAAEALRGQRLQVTVADLDTQGRVTRSITLP